MSGCVITPFPNPIDQGVTEQTQAATGVDLRDLADIESWQAVGDEALITIWRAAITLPGYCDAATLLARML